MFDVVMCSRGVLSGQIPRTSVDRRASLLLFGEQGGQEDITIFLTTHQLLQTIRKVKFSQLEQFWLKWTCTFTLFRTKGRNLHFAQHVTLFTRDITYFQQRVTLEQNFTSLTHVIKIEV